jgi:hypothetical protein
MSSTSPGRGLGVPSPGATSELHRQVDAQAVIAGEPPPDERPSHERPSEDCRSFGLQNSTANSMRSP